jgi:hypothetical protein
MDTPTSIVLLTIAVIGPSLVASIFVVEGLIVRSVCRAEGRPFSPFWFADWHWHKRILSLAWFRQASDAGYLTLRLSIYGGWALILLGMIVVLRRD